MIFSFSDNTGGSGMQRASMEASRWFTKRKESSWSAKNKPRLELETTSVWLLLLQQGWRGTHSIPAGAEEGVTGKCWVQCSSPGGHGSRDRYPATRGSCTMAHLPRVCSQTCPLGTLSWRTAVHSLVSVLPVLGMPLSQQCSNTVPLSISEVSTLCARQLCPF